MSECSRFEDIPNAALLTVQVDGDGVQDMLAGPLLAPVEAYIRKGGDARHRALAALGEAGRVQ